MAIKVIEKVKLTRNEGKVVPFVAATSTTDGFALSAKGADYETAYEFFNSGAAAYTVTVKVGSGIQGVGDDLVVNLAAGEYATLVVDSGAYKQVSGDNAGYVLAIPSNVAVQARVVELP